MNRPDPDSNTFDCKSGESITVNITSENTAHLVSYVLGAKKGHLAENETLTFSVTTGQGITRLTLLLTYAPSGDQTASYTVEITGNQGGGTYKDDYSQSFAVPADGPIYFFEVTQ